jgi:hypothetical protein
MSGGGWVLLGERPPEEIALGLVGKFWRPVIEFADVDAQAFRDFAEPGFATTIYALGTRPLDKRTLLWATMRTATTDEHARASATARSSSAVRRRPRPATSPPPIIAPAPLCLHHEHLGVNGEQRASRGKEVPFRGSEGPRRCRLRFRETNPMLTGRGEALPEVIRSTSAPARNIHQRRRWRL